MVMVLTSRVIYGRALVCFYIVFEELERQLNEIAPTTDFWQAVWSTLQPINRTSAFEADLQVSVCVRSEEQTSELQSLMRISYAVFCLKKQKINSKSSRT